MDATARVVVCAMRMLLVVRLALVALVLAVPAWAQDAKELYNKGVGLATAGQLEQAADLFRQATEKDASFTLAHYNLGVAMQKLKRHAEALPAFQEAFRLDPNYQPAIMNVGATYQAMGNAAESAKAYREAVRLKPDDTEAQFGLSWMLLQIKSPDAAAEYEKLARLSKSRADALYNDYHALPGSTPAPSADPAPGPTPEAAPPASAAPSVPASASPAPDAGAPVTLVYRASAAPVRYRVTERMAVVTGDGDKRTRVQTLRELVYAVSAASASGGVARRITLESAKITRDGRELPAPKREPAQSQLAANGEPVSVTGGIEPALCRPVFPAGPVAPGAQWSRTLTPIPGSFPPVAVQLEAKLDRMQVQDGAAWARVALTGASAPGAGSAKLNAIVLWDVAAGQLAKLKGRGVSEDAVARPGAAAVPRKISYDVSVDRVP